MQTLLIRKLHPDAVIPVRATSGSAGYDLCARIDKPVTVPARGMTAIPTGIAVAIEQPGVAGFVFGRSGLGFHHGICPSNAVGVIDSDYRGEICVGLTNHSDADYTIQPGERIAQLVLMPIFTPTPAETDTLPETARGVGGFGSTGR